MDKPKQADLGDAVVDTVSGFKGIVTSVTQYLHGCEQCGVQAPMLKDGKIGEVYSFDRPRLKVVTKGKIKVGSRETGGPSRQLSVSPSRR
jgi:MinD superfamily P-loop ATPase